MFIYLITNKINGKQYVGQTTGTIKNRFKNHKKQAKYPYYKKYHLHDAIIKYGTKNFSVSELDTAQTLDELNEKEIFWIKTLDTKNNGYNETDGGKGCSGRSWSEESREKQRIKMNLYYENWSEEERKNLSDKAKQQWENKTKEEKQKVAECTSKTHKGKPKSKTTRHNMKKSWELRPEFTEEHKNNISKARKRENAFVGINNPMNNKESRNKLAKTASSRYKISREDGSWYWGHMG